LDATHTKSELASSSLPQYKIGNQFKLTKREALQTVHDRRDTLKKGKLCRQSTTEEIPSKRPEKLGSTREEQRLTASIITAIAPTTCL
jgi:hypothetical protein